MVAVKAFLLLWALGVVAVSLANRTADFTTVKGQLSWSPDRFAVVSECATKRVLRFDVMATVPYVALQQRYYELSQGGQLPVLIEVEGRIGRTSSSDEERLQGPRLIALTPGTCDERPDPR